MWSALPPYLGGKRRLCPLIFREVDGIVPRREWSRLTFLDAFLGGGSVSLYAKAQGFQVIATDIADRAIIIGRALIENSRVRLTREDVLRVLRPRKGSPGPVEATMSPAVFLKKQARFIDEAIRVGNETADPAKSALIKFLAMRVALLAHPYSQVRKGTIHRMTTGEYESITESAAYHYVDGLRLTTTKKLWELAQQINAGVFEGRGTVMKRSVLEALPEIEADVAYFDPPYPGVMSYEKEYKVVDQIFEGASRPTSPFTAKDGARMLDGLFERARHIPIWVLSLGNAVVSVEELESKMAKHGRRTKAIALKYQHLPAVATEEKKRTNLELLVVGVDPDSALVREAQVGMQFVGIDRPLSGAIVHHDAGAGRTERPGAGGLGQDPLQEGGAHKTQELASFLRSEAFAEDNTGLDEPDPVVAQRRPRLDGEIGFRGHDSRGSLGTESHVKEDSR